MIQESVIQKTLSRESFFLAGLLHDIGKFYQRADKGLSDKQNELTDYSKRIAEDICPVNDQGRFGYQHVIWTNEFFEKFKRKLNEIPGVKDNLFITDNFGENNIVNFAVNHHKPQNIFQAIITLADWWSAGIDRTDPKTLEKQQIEEKIIDWGKKRYKSIPLYSIFNNVKQGNYKNTFPLKKLNIENNKDIFPRLTEKKEDGVSEQEYFELWKGFEKEFEQLPSDSINVFTESLIYLLKKYTWCIPSNTMDMANVSLYEHLKTTAAFSDCFYAYYIENPGDFKWNEPDKRLSLKEGAYPVLILGGDISGIQKFIYNISSQGAAKSLKGRSFYLQLLIDSIIHKIISHENIQACIGHVIYSSGGKFYMLLPNTEKIINALNEIKAELEKELWHEHHGKLIFNMDYVCFSYRKNKIEYNDKGEQDLGGLWRTLADKLAQQKNRKFNSLIINDYDEFFKINENGGDVKVCAVTGLELKNEEAVKLDKESDLIVSIQVKKNKELGNALKYADFNIMFKGNEADSKYLSKRLKNKTIVAGIANYLFDARDFIKDDEGFRNVSSSDASRVRLINKTNFLDSQIKGKQVSYGFHFYGGNKQAQKLNGENKTFEELTRTERDNKDSESYLGILRMDVDDMGDLFINGLKEEEKSFAAYATMSFLFDLFFSGYLNYIRDEFRIIESKTSDREGYKYNDWVNILYSGGDDIFAIGRWDKIIEFAEDIRSEFRRFMGMADISLSAGITIVNNKFPIAKAAELAGQAEKAAKKNVLNGKKNAICFLGETVSWDQEFQFVKDRKEQFITLINQKGMSKGILHRLMAFSLVQKENERRNKVEEGFKPDLSYKWNSLYYLKRFMDRHNEKEGVKEFIKTLQEELLFPRNYNLIALSARWAELELKQMG